MILIIYQICLKVRSICGETYLLNQDEELWKKELSEEVEELLMVDPLAYRSTKKKIGVTLYRLKN